MKKILTSTLLCSILVLASALTVGAYTVVSPHDYSVSDKLVANLSPSDSHTEKPPQQVQSHLLYGRWLWDGNSSWVMHFLPGNLLLDGHEGEQIERRWDIVNGRLFVDGHDWEINLFGCHTFFTVNRHDYGSDSTFYIRDWNYAYPDWDSDYEYEIIVTLIGLIILGALCLLCLSPFVVIIILIALLAGKRSKKDQVPLWTTGQYPPNNFPPTPPHNYPQPPASNYYAQNMPPPPPNFPPSRPQTPTPPVPPALPNPPQIRGEQ